MPVSAIRQHTLRAYCHVPHGPFDMSARIEAQIERFFGAQQRRDAGNEKCGR
jgi:hypothetical protein